MLPWQCFCEVALWHGHDCGMEALSHGATLQGASVKPRTTQAHSHLLASSNREHVPSHFAEGLKVTAMVELVVRTLVCLALCLLCF